MMKQKIELDKIEETEKIIDRVKLFCRASEFTYDFRNFRTVRTFGRDIYENIISLEEAYKDQNNLVRDIKDFKYKTRPQNNDKKQEKEIFLKNLLNFFDARELVLNGFSSRIFLIKSKGPGLLNTDKSKLKILTPKQMLQG